ncbi:MAG: hypothetical protein B7C55_08045 [Actinomycetales bacterium mxb001]|nr:MAG: hypothetical protein B7C55_08045 [Actinomycetales bacterium mxb001]
MTTNTTTTISPVCKGIISTLKRAGVHVVVDPGIRTGYNAKGMYYQGTIWLQGQPTGDCGTLAHEAVHWLQEQPGGDALMGRQAVPKGKEAVINLVQSRYNSLAWEAEYAAWALQDQPEVVLKLLEQAAPPPLPPPQGIPAPLGVGMAIAITALATWIMLRD